MRDYIPVDLHARLIPSDDPDASGIVVQRQSPVLVHPVAFTVVFRVGLCTRTNRRQHRKVERCDEVTYHETKRRSGYSKVSRLRMKRAAQPGRLFAIDRLAYRASFLRSTTSIPSAPVASSARLSGSGVVRNANPTTFVLDPNGPTSVVAPVDGSMV